MLPDYQCFGCSPHNAAGLRLRFFETADGDGLETPLAFGRGHESYPGVVHGGIVATVCDEIMGNLLVLRTGITALHRHAADPLPDPAGGRRGVPVRGRRVRPEPGPGGQRQATAEVVDGDGATVASASGTYQPASADASRQHLALSDADRRLLDEAMSTVSDQRGHHTSGRDRG